MLNDRHTSNCDTRAILNAILCPRDLEGMKMPDGNNLIIDDDMDVYSPAEIIEGMSKHAPRDIFLAIKFADGRTMRLLFQQIDYLLCRLKEIVSQN